MCPPLCRISPHDRILIALCAQEAMLDFRSGKVQVLVATDVAARGLHIRGLPYIINYDFPSRLEPYIHRVGRTGRLTSTGHAFSFFTRNLAPLARPLLALLQVSLLSLLFRRFSVFRSSPTSGMCWTTNNEKLPIEHL